MKPVIFKIKDRLQSKKSNNGSELPESVAEHFESTPKQKDNTS